MGDVCWICSDFLSTSVYLPKLLKEGFFISWRIYIFTFSILMGIIMKKFISYIVLLVVTISFAFATSGCTLVAEEAKWYAQNVKEKGLYTASLEFTETAISIGGATAIVAPEIGVLLAVYALESASKMDTMETILTIGNVAGFAAGTVLILAPAAAISAVGLATQGLPENYEHGSLPFLSYNTGASCHRDYDCVGTVCDFAICRSRIDANDCIASSDGAYKSHCLEYSGQKKAEPKEPDCLLDIDCANGLCLNGKCAPDIACEKREDCPLSNHACINSLCLVYKNCAIDQDCLDRKDGTNYCNAELECVEKLECETDSDCSGDSMCYQDVCIDCRFDSECSDGLMCFNGHCTAPEAIPAAAMGE